MNQKLSVIIPTKNRKNILNETIKALLIACENLDVEIIVVNDSKEENIEINSKIVNIINNPKQGVASARNYGFKNSIGEILLFLDDDMIVSENVLLDLMTKIKSSEKSIFLPSWVYPNETKKRLNITKFGRFLNKIDYTSLKGWLKNVEWKKDEIFNHNGIASYCLMFKRIDFETLGGYNESFPHAGFEDYDLSKRLEKLGFNFFIVPQLEIYHNETDRITLIEWLQRKRRNASTQRKAVDLGYSEMKIIYNRFKIIYFTVFHKIEPLALVVCEKIPNIIVFDSLYIFLVKRLVGLHIFLGYNIDYEK